MDDTIASALPDLRDKPLSYLAEDVLARLVPAPQASQVPVATFNSTIA